MGQVSVSQLVFQSLNMKMFFHIGILFLFFITGSIPMNLKMTRMIFLIGKTMNETMDHLLQQEMDQFEGL